jgi:hypothetical protein
LNVAQPHATTDEHPLMLEPDSTIPNTVPTLDNMHGKVKLFLGGQKCLKCNGVFENAMWHNLCIERAITKLLNKVKQSQKFYALNVPTSTTGNTYTDPSRYVRPSPNKSL